MAKKHIWRKSCPSYKEKVGARHCSMKRRKVAQLSEAQGHRCCYCSGKTFLVQPLEKLPLGMSHSQRATLEHLIPQCEPVQTNKDENLVMACANCNTLRGLSDPIKFYNRLKHYHPPQPKPIHRIPMSVKKFLKQKQKQERALVICLIATMLWPEDTAYWAENWKPRTKVRGKTNRSRKINKIALTVTSDPRRLAA